MKNTLLLTLLVVFYSSIGGCTKVPDSYRIVGEIEGYGTGQMVFTHALPTGRVKDTIQIVDDKFIYAGESVGPHLVFFRVFGNQVLNRPFVQGAFIIENTEMHFNALVESISKFELLGSPSNTKLKSIYANAGTITSDFSKAKSSYRKAVINKKPSHVTEKLSQDLTKKTEAYVDYLMQIPNYSTNHAVPYVIYNNFSDIPRDVVKEMLSRFSDDFNNVYLTYMRERIKNEESIYIGVDAPNFSLPDIDGNVYTLENYKRKYLLLTFTASWCTWCKKEIPFLKKAYKLYGDKGLDILTVNLDKTRDLWVKDLEKHPVPWPVVSDVKAFKGPIIRKYAISAIPRIFLIDPKGKIIGMNLRGEKILEALSKVL